MQTRQAGTHFSKRFACLKRLTPARWLKAEISLSHPMRWQEQ
jgi:hypothetical protein